jgi:hypothetical protein
MGPQTHLSLAAQATLSEDFCRFLLARDGTLAGDSKVLPNRPVPVGLACAARDDDGMLTETLERLYVGDRYAVDVAAEKSAHGADSVERLIAREEHYHTELIAYTLMCLGHAVPAHVPPRAMRPLLKALVFLPHPLSTILLFCGEYIGVLLMLAVRARLGAPVGGRARVVPTIDEILVDEIGHMAFNHGRLSRVELWLAHRLLGPLVRLAAMREPLMRPLLRQRRRLMSWRSLDAIASGGAFLPAVLDRAPVAPAPAGPGSGRAPGSRR